MKQYFNGNYLIYETEKHNITELTHCTLLRTKFNIYKGYISLTYVIKLYNTKIINLVIMQFHI